MAGGNRNKSVLNFTPLQTLDWRGVWHPWIISGCETLRKKNTVEHGFRWEEDFEMDLIETGWESMNWFCLAEDKDLCEACVHKLMKFWIS
jgi:hypothetical protein